MFLVRLDLILQRISRELPLIVGDTPKLYATRDLLLAVVVPMNLSLAFPYTMPVNASAELLLLTPI